MGVDYPDLVGKSRCQRGLEQFPSKDDLFALVSIQIVDRYVRAPPDLFDANHDPLAVWKQGAAAHSNDQFAPDAVAVLDAVGCAVLGGSPAARPALCRSPPSIRPGPRPRRGVAVQRVRHPAARAGRRPPWHQPRGSYDGWAAHNRQTWLDGDDDAFLRFFFAETASEPHSSTQIEECSGWGHEIDRRVLVDSEAGRLG